MLRALVGIDDPVSSIYIEEYFGNGSFVLSNGVIVLSNEDLELYYNGTLVLPNYCDCIDCDSYCDDCINCDDHCHECMDCDSHLHDSEVIDDSMYLYFDRRRFNYNYDLSTKGEDFFKRQ